MASMKRYKQQSENNCRFQDIPPRFKRQKSFTSHKLPQSVDSGDQNNCPLGKNKKAPLGDLYNMNGALNQQQKGSQFPREGRKIVKKLSTQKAQLNAEKSLLKPTAQPFVLSPMENKLFSLIRNDECENQIYSIPTSHNSPNANQQQSFSQSLSTNSDDNINANTSPGWEKNPISNPPSHHKEDNINYTDPDIRTIEMLRELERVADQTDVGSDESCNDKNSLVSHHLRMLMCAVDRYTQGVDEEIENDNSCEDVYLSQDEPRHIPSPPPVHEQDLFHQNHMQEKEVHASTYTKHANPSTVFSPMVYQPMLNTWNPWTTPTFNALDVYSTTNTTSPSTYFNPAMMVDPSSFMVDHEKLHYARDSCF